VIIRILGEGQYRVDDAALAAINELDAKLLVAVQEMEATYAAHAKALAAAVSTHGTPLAVDEFLPSDAVVPGPDTTLAEALNLLTEDGLVPG
jgi:hypothetical protein